MDGPSEPRKRSESNRPPGLPASIDPIGFTANQSSSNARKIFITKEQFEISGWFDKHYHIRHQIGDGDGRREGIDPESVESLVKKSIRFLLLFAAAIKGFKFMNYPAAPDAGTRVIIRELLKNTFLNIVLQSHYLDGANFEITVVTAMSTNEFKVSAGQYIVEILGNEAELIKFDNKKFIKIVSL